MSLLDQFIAYLNAQVEIHAIYVWGAQGQTSATISEKWIRRCEADTGGYKNGPTYADAAVDYWKKQCALGFQKILKAFDCSGLGIYWLYNLMHLIPGDRNANGMRSMCTLISLSQRRRGCWLFRVNKDKGKATHIGYMVTDTLVVHAKGRLFGVVREPVNVSYWHQCGIPKLFASEILIGSGSAAADSANAVYTFTRVLKSGAKGDDVKALKKLLTAAGYAGLSVSNGNYYSATEAKVKAFQKAKGLEADGKAGKQTITALGGTWAG